jgi:hypothetical protein
VESIVEVERGQTVAAQNTRTEAFVVHASRAEIANFAREGNSLIVEFTDGAKLRIDDFFTRSNQLVFVEGGQHYLADLSSAVNQGGDGIADELIQWYTPAEGVATNTATDAAADDSSDDSSMLLMSLLGVGVGAGLIYHYRHHHKSGSGEQEPPPPAPEAPTSYIDHRGESSAPSTAPTTTDANPSINIGPLQEGQTANLYVDGQKVPADSQPGMLTPHRPLADGTHEITYTVSDSNGNESAQSEPLTIAVEAGPVIVIDGPIADDDVIDAQEAAALTLSGYTANVEDGQIVTVTFSDNSNSLLATAEVHDGSWSIDATDISSLNDGPISVSAMVSNQAGESAQIINHSATLDSSLAGTGNDMPMASDDNTANNAPTTSDDGVNTTENTASSVSSTEDVNNVTIGVSEPFHIGGSDSTQLYRLLSETDATGGNGSGTVDNFKLGIYGETSQASRIDVAQLLTGYHPANADGPARYVDGRATIDAGDSIGNYLKAAPDGHGNTVIRIDRDGAGSSFSTTPLVTLNSVDTDLSTLLANHQIVVDHG